MAKYRIPRRRSALLAAAAVLPLAMAAPAAAQSDNDVLRVVPQADLQNLDPVWTTAIITSNHAALVYDNLFGVNSDFLPQPQMVESWEVSDDQLTWTFVLREGLVFHDGSPVEAKDVAPSIDRWAARITAGQTMYTRVKETRAVDARTFEIEFNAPFAPVLEALATGGNMLFIMREQEALTDPHQQVAEVVGSGPYRFMRDEWEPGNTVIYERFEEYVPRDDEPSALAGGKIAYIPRIQWVYIPDPNTAAQALMTGEVDFLDKPQPDLLPLLAADPDIEVEVVNTQGNQGILMPNHLNPPFDNPTMRRGLLYLVGDQIPHLSAMVGSPDLYDQCWSVFFCNAPLETDAGVGDWATNDLDTNIARARELFEEGGYDGRPIVLIDPTDFEVIHNMVLVTAQRMRDAGLNVDVQAMDWSTLTSRRSTKDDPQTNPAGWHVFHTYGTASGGADPLAANPPATPCDGTNWFGWPCDDELNDIRLQFITTAAEDRIPLVERFHTRFYESVPYVTLGQFYEPVAYRSNLSGVLTPAPRQILWNIQKN